MNAFQVHADIIARYRQYLQSFVRISDDDIRKKVDAELNDTDRLIPQPLVNFNPDYEIGGNTSELVAQGLLDSQLNDVFPGYALYRHQLEAIELGSQGRGFVVTSGTGSGKSLTYLATIFDDLFRNPNQPGGVALLVYPMNALINSQEEEIKKYAKEYQERTGRAFPITFAKYTGQEGEEERNRHRENPPHILLTNYMMLELILTRPQEQKISGSLNSNLKYLVFDELHTYRGRQGADVAMLIRRIRAQADRKSGLICIGTSATLASGEGGQSPKVAAAKVASDFFGTEFSQEQIVLETLARSFTDAPPARQQLREAVASLQADRPDANEAELKDNPLAAWIEQNFSLAIQDGRLVRGRPRTIQEIVEALAAASEVDTDAAKRAVENLLNWAMRVNIAIKDRKPRKSYLPYRLHQFVQQTGKVYVTLEAPGLRHIQMEERLNIENKNGDKLPLFQAAFSRLTGKTFLSVFYDGKDQRLKPCPFDRGYTAEENEDDLEAAQVRRGYFVLQEPDQPDLWTSEDEESLPPAWFTEKKKEGLTLKKDKRELLPDKMWCDQFGRVYRHPGEGRLAGWFLRFPLSIDPTAKAVYETATRRSSELEALISVGLDARSTANTLLSYLTVQEQLKQSFQSAKVMCFVDYRQDASLQAGHFNDFVRTVALRSALMQAVENAPEGQPVRLSNVGRLLFEVLDLPFLDYADMSEELEGKLRESYEKQFQKLLFYWAMRDLRLGWRVIMPNLEQTAQIRVAYESLDEQLEDDSLLEKVAFALGEELRAENRGAIQSLVRETLDFFRRSFAIRYEEYEELAKEFKFDKLNDSWAPDADEKAEKPTAFYIEKVKGAKLDSHNLQSIGSASTFGRYFRGVYREITSGSATFKKADYLPVVKDFLNVLCKYGFLCKEEMKTKGPELAHIYQLNGTLIRWKKGDGTSPYHDNVRLPLMKNVELPPPNSFFQQLYQTPVREVLRLNAHEHTGQIDHETRQQCEKDFREGQLSVLYCSPTMELGIDISDLSVVQLRNVPPNPANYAQRSGRAGRSGQAALVFTYCSRYSAHDQHYFREKESMVAGQVKPPVFDFSNEELLVSHLHALCMPFLSLEMSKSITEVVDETANAKGWREFAIKDEVKNRFTALKDAKDRANIRQNFNVMIQDLKDDLEQTRWFKAEDWFEQRLNSAFQVFDDAFDRWRDLYRSAEKLLLDSRKIMEDPTISDKDPRKVEAKRTQSFAQRQIDLLRNAPALDFPDSKRDFGSGPKKKNTSIISEFQPYRYLAAEGFLPGYNFTRRPLNLSLRSGQDEIIDRPRFIALREAGPENFFYHKGRKFQVKYMTWNPDERPPRTFRLTNSLGLLLGEEDRSVNNCPITGEDLTQGASYQRLTEMVEFGPSTATVRQRINCNEEERQRAGYDIQTAFAIDREQGGFVSILTQDADRQTLANAYYIPGARIYQINHGWKRDKPSDGNETGFYIDVSRNGQWVSRSQLEERRKAADRSQRDPTRRLKLYVDRTADALLLRPAPGLTFEGIEGCDPYRTFLYAFIKGLEHTLNVEPRELAGDLLGQNNILIYEDAEGSMGLLRQFAANPGSLKQVFERAQQLCCLDAESLRDEELQRQRGDASYLDLLDFGNQIYHAEINRFSIKTTLEQLLAAEYAVLQGSLDREAHYRHLMGRIDANSDGEKKFLEYLYHNGLRLPDEAQKLFSECYVQPDFYYKQGNVAVFIDGKPHDKPEMQQADEQKRRCLENQGVSVLAWHYLTDLRDFVVQNRNVFEA